jgi:predicted amidophosphoribosyltransferase
MHQIGQSRSQRLQQIHGAFYLPRAQQVQARRILVIDDVLTTGATLEETARTLRQAGASLVWAAVVARH